MSILFSAYSQSDFFGKCIFFGLFLLSFICWVLLIYKTLQAKKVKKLSKRFESLIAAQKERLLHLPIEEMAHPFASIFSELKQKTGEILKKNHYFSSQGESKSAAYLSRTDLELIESHVLTTVSMETKRLEKNLFILSTIATLAPFLGLLGTVWGILLTFAGLQSSAAISSNSVILSGLSTALATTVLGLVIAIPALIFYNYLKNGLKEFSSDMEDFLYRMLSTVELQYRKP